MTRLVWTRSLSSCSGARAWSALVKQTQITAWWACSLPRETTDNTASTSVVELNLTCHLFLFPHPSSLPPTAESWWQCDGVRWPAAGCAVDRTRLQEPSWSQCLHQAVLVQWLDQSCNGALHTHNYCPSSDDDMRQQRDTYVQIKCKHYYKHWFWLLNWERNMLKPKV